MRTTIKALAGAGLAAAIVLTGSAAQAAPVKSNGSKAGASLSGASLSGASLSGASQQ